MGCGLCAVVRWGACDAMRVGFGAGCDVARVDLVLCKKPGMSKPTHRTIGKASQAQRDEKHHAAMSAALFGDYANETERHAKKAAKLAKTIRDTVITTKPAGRDGPTRKRYTRTVTEKSLQPITK